jgi:RNA polymerase sigma-70 factor (ECF subfamily)
MGGQMQAATNTSQVDTFQDRRDLLFGVAYRVLGSAVDAEDVVQESWLRWSRVDQTTVTDPTSFLMQVSTRLAIDRLRKLKASRESYIGPWLPEPLPTAHDVAEDIDLSESVSMAMLVVLETLSPLERVVFVLREAFEFSFAEIATVLSRNESAVRQVARRARDHVQERRPRFIHDRRIRRQATERFLAACIGADVNGLLNALDPDVTLWGDGGGTRGAPRVPIRGAHKVARLLATVGERGPRDMSVRVIDVNGGPAAVFSTGGKPFAVVILDLQPADDRIGTVWLVTNPEKLARLSLH